VNLHNFKKIRSQAKSARQQILLYSAEAHWELMNKALLNRSQTRRYSAGFYSFNRGLSWQDVQFFSSKWVILHKLRRSFARKRHFILLMLWLR